VVIRAADEQAKRMTDDRGNQMAEMPLSDDAEPPRGPSADIFDALDMDGVGEIDITFERPPSHPRPATSD
jgi:hypothetical protein